MPDTEQRPVETAAPAPAAKGGTIAILARAVADHAIDRRPCGFDCIAPTEAWRAALAEDIAALGRAQATAADDKAAAAIELVEELVSAWDDSADVTLFAHRIQRLLQRAREIV